MILINNKKLYKLFLAITIMILFLGNSLPVYASETDELSPYKERLEELNEKLGTDYIIDGNDKTVVDYFKNMSIDEFEQFICEAYKNDTNYGENYLPKTMNDIVNNGISRSNNTLKRVEQKSYYDNYGNYFALLANETTGNNPQYVQFISGGYNKTPKGYPYYKVSYATGKISKNGKVMSVTYKCSKYVAANITDATVRKLTINYTAI